MPMQTGVGFAKIMFLVGAGYTGVMLCKNIKFSNVLGKLQALVKDLEKSKEQSKCDSDYSDAVAAAAAAQVRRLAMEVRLLGYNFQITVRNENSGHSGNITSLIIPAASLGVLGCGYMCWKGFSFSDLICVTKRNMANAVSNLTKYLEHVTKALAATKRHLKQRIENLDNRMLKQNEHVVGVQKSHSDIDFDLRQLQNIVSGLDGKISSLEYKQVKNFLKQVELSASLASGRRGQLLLFPRGLDNLSKHDSLAMAAFCFSLAILND